MKLDLRGGDLNPRPLGYEPNELPDCSTPRHEKKISVTHEPRRAADVYFLRSPLLTARPEL